MKNFRMISQSNPNMKIYKGYMESILGKKTKRLHMLIGENFYTIIRNHVPLRH